MKLNDLYNGLTIIDATLAESGPVTSQTFAMLGANVIHIERPADKPDKRYVGYLVRENNKKCITLDTKTEEGKAIMWKLIEKADVFLENFAPGAWNRMGFTYEEVKKHNPRIVYATIKGFAQGTRFEKCITYDPVACCSGGGTFLTGLEDGDPMLCGINVGDSGAAIMSDVNMAAAILRQRLTGEGCFVECPMQNAVVAESRQSFAEYYATNGKVRRAGNSYRGVKPTAPWNIYPCQGNDITGNYIVICCGADEDNHDFINLCKAMGREDLISNPDYATPALRYENRHNLDYEISQWTIKHPKRWLMTRLALEFRVPAGVVMGPGDMLRGKKQGNSNGIIRWLDFCEDEYCKDRRGKQLAGVYMPTLPLRMEAGDIQPEFCGRYNACNREIYIDLLGISEQEFAMLEEKHVI